MSEEINQKKKRRNPFTIGLIVLLPTLITIFIIVMLFKFLVNNIGGPLGTAVMALFNWETTPLAESIIGLFLAISIIFLMGYFTATFIGRTIFKLFETWFIKKFPLINTIYPYAKQFTEIILSEEHKADFRMVVAVQYPRPGLYSIAFVTSEGMKDINSAVGKECVTIFIPSSPTPFTGYTLFVPRTDLIPLKLSVDEAIRLSVSGGILIPPHQLVKLKQQP